MKKIFIIYTSVGLGHKVVAENIAQALRKFPGIEVSLLDLLQFYKSSLTKASTNIYEVIIKYFPWLWRFFYTNKIFHNLTLPLRVPFASLKVRKLEFLLQKEKPDLVLTTHPAATALMSYLKQKKRYVNPLVTTFSDFHLQPYWVYPHVDRYLVQTLEQKTGIIKRGFSPQQVVVTGLPVNHAFAQDFEPRAVRQEFELAKNKPLVLLMGGSRSWGIRLEDISALLDSILDFYIVVLVSFNRDLFKRLEKFAQSYPANLKVFGNLTSLEVAKLFSVAKILVTKPGGLSVAQALARSLPMVLVNPLPAMEEQNQVYLVRSGLALAASDSQELRAWVERLLQDKKLYSDTKARLRLYAQPNAAQRAAQTIIDMLEKRY